MAKKATAKAAPKAAGSAWAESGAHMAGRQAAGEGVNIAACPYKGAARAAWIAGHVEAANEAAPERRRRRR